MSNLFLGLGTTDSLIYILFNILSGLIGFWIALSIFRKKERKWLAEFESLKGDMERLRGDNDILVKQAKLMTPETEVTDLRNRLQIAEQDKLRINGDFLSQSATIRSLNAQLSSLTADHEQLKLDATTPSQVAATQLTEIQDTLNMTRNKINEVGAENDALRAELAQYKGAANILVKPSVGGGSMKTPYGDVPVDELTAPVIVRPVSPVVESPKADVPVVEVPKVVTPVVEVPKVDVPVVEAPKIAPPVVEIPHVAVPLVNAPKVAPPVVDLPHLNTPHIEVPAIGAITTGVAVAAVTMPPIEVPKVEVPSLGILWR